jgi:hypothetical protein
MQKDDPCEPRGGGVRRRDRGAAGAAAALAAAARERPELAVGGARTPRPGGLALAERPRPLGVPVALASAALARPPGGGAPFVAEPVDPSSHKWPF